MKQINNINTIAAQTRDAALYEYYSLVKIIAKKMATRLPASVDVDDLISAGLIGLVQALERFDASKGYKFKTFAEFRIRGAMIDELRSQDWCPKGIRQKAKQFEKICEKIAASKGRHATENELCEELHLSKPKLDQLIRDVNTLEQMNLATYIRIGSEENTKTIDLLAVEETPYEEANRHNIREVLDQAMRHLPDSERNILSLYYFEELNLKQIGAKLHLSESRVCQLHSLAIEHLKKSLNEEQQDLAA